MDRVRGGRAGRNQLSLDPFARFPNTAAAGQDRRSQFPLLVSGRPISRVFRGRKIEEDSGERGIAPDPLRCDPAWGFAKYGRWGNVECRWRHRVCAGAWIATHASLGKWRSRHAGPSARRLRGRHGTRLATGAGRWPPCAVSFAKARLLEERKRCGGPRVAETRAGHAQSPSGCVGASWRFSVPTRRSVVRAEDGPANVSTHWRSRSDRGGSHGQRSEWAGSIRCFCRRSAGLSCGSASGRRTVSLA